eukprot:TRINITY_DN906_c1_g5_i2.p1 TRINITY_DN906_c1_g5~~TRINITY_DN906_c1_g5_i2.p1  ORF type:complete len:697 (-),score=189.89 TRINITY_DN906_c1_g5_i2:8-2098(-)
MKAVATSVAGAMLSAQLTQAFVAPSSPVLQRHTEHAAVSSSPASSSSGQTTLSSAAPAALAAGFIAAAVGAGAMKQKVASTGRSSQAIVAQAYDASKEIGACDPLLFWDPIGFCEGGSKEDFDRRRAVELKHGRLAMFATLGMLWPDVFGKFDGYLSPSQNLKFSDIPTGVFAVSKVPGEGWAQILLVAGLIETQLFGDKSIGGPGFAKYGSEPGNFGTGYWGRKIKDPEERRLKLTTELNNGRLAMVSFMGLALQNGLTGQSPIEQWQSGHISPFNDGQGFFAVQRRAGYDASKELGACPPLGYWDPFGMMAFQDKAKFEKNRELELKHGRICMAATIGMIVPDVFGRLPGYLSPSMGLKFTDIPSSIEAVGKVPVEGWLQIFAFAGAIEAKNLAFPTNYGYPPFLGGINKLSKEESEKKRLAEINNCRLAMVAFSAMVAQNGATGQSLVEQFSTGNLNPFVGGYAKKERLGRTTMYAAGKNQSIALPWAPCPPSLSNNPKGEYVGDVGFDPLEFSKNKRLLPWYREAELAHGRVCMLAVLGFSVQTAGAKFEPFITRYPTSSDDALKAATQVPTIGWLQIIVAIGLTELWRYENVISKYEDGVRPGDLGWNPDAPVNGTRPKWFGPTFTAKYTTDEFNDLKLREMKHARLAMFGFAFMVVQNAITGKTPTVLFWTMAETPEYYTTVGDFIPKNL